MYSLIIQNNKTAESFQEHLPIFLEALEDGELGCCRWVESGNDLATALPELSDLVNDREEWRAVIVRILDEGGMQPYMGSVYNPYDFAGNHREGVKSDIPLVSLTQMLGGVPTPEIEFEKHVEQGEGVAPHIFYKPVYNEKKQNEYEKLQELYSFNGRYPVEIWLITMREVVKNDQRKLVKEAWEEHSELYSSEFWRRNGYSSMCRFMVYDYENMGPVQKTADMFSFWMSIRMLVSNEISPSTLQGYRLYRINTEFDKELMQECFQRNADKLMGIRKDIRERLRRAQEERMQHLRRNPELEANIDLVELDNLSSTGVNEKVFRTFARREREELSNWRTMSASALGDLQRLVKQAGRKLNEQAELIRDRNHIATDDVVMLDRFEAEELEVNLERRYNRILKKQKELPDTSVLETEEEKKQSESIVELIRTRVDNRRALTVAIAIDIVILILAVPVFMQYAITHDVEKSMHAVALALFFMLFLMIAMELCFLWSRHRLRKMIRSYNSMLNERLHTIKQNEGAYTAFVNDIVYYARGRSYQRGMEEKNIHEESIISVYDKHLYAVNRFADRIERWGRAFFVDVNFRDDAATTLIIDALIAPVHNMAYTFDSGNEYEIPLNGNGDYVLSPFEFVKGLTISREELFDNENSDQ